jgi:hypothetical protein
MIVFIGGYGCTSKTKLANDLMILCKIPYLSIDVVMMGMYRSNLNCGYTPMSPRDEISNKVVPVILEMAKTNIENGMSYVYEGFQIRPNDCATIEDTYSRNTLSYFIGYSEKYLHENYAMIKEKRSIIEKRCDIDSMDKMIEDNYSLYSECKKEKQYFHCIEDNYEKEIGALLEKVVIDIRNHDENDYSM